jgi:peptidoglycan/xylan/chitin deacetylase (PgdA/CDA1 family)
MVMTLLASSAMAALLAISPPIAREVAVTFDDLPVVRSTPGDARVTRDLLRNITGAKIPAVGFVNENKLGDAKLLEQWLDAGLDLGNHTFSHLDLHRAGVEAYEKDIVRGERVTRALLEKRGRAPRWFRHPFLHTGLTITDRDEVNRFLRNRGYRVAPVTLDNSEWIFALAYDRTSDAVTRERIGREYVAYMDRKLAYFEQQSMQLFGRNIRHVLLVHANALNADWFDEIAASMRMRGYRFITLDRALDDPAYRSADAYHGSAGITWIHRWAITQGKPKAFFAGSRPRRSGSSTRRESIPNELAPLPVHPLPVPPVAQQRGELKTAEDSE